VAEWEQAYRESRVDLDEKTLLGVAAAMHRIRPRFGKVDPGTIRPADVQEWIVHDLVAGDPARGLRPLKPGTVKQYVSTLRLILDFAGVEPNPARHRTVRLPSAIVEEPQPPSADHLLAILDAAPARWRLPWVTMEQTGVRGEAIEHLVWGDVDLLQQRFRLRAETTKRRRALWVQVPGWLLTLIEETCPLEDRVENRRVFPGFTVNHSGVVMARACRHAGVPAYSPHDLRHRRISLWHGQGVPARELADRVGHARPSMSLDVYSHVLLDPREITSGEYATVLSRP
jgi:integrase